MDYRMHGVSNIRRSPTKHWRNRRGLAPIEFIPFLPIFMIFLLAVYWVARVRLSEMQAGHNAAQQVQLAIAEYEAGDAIPQEEQWSSPNAPELRRLLRAFAPAIPLTAGVVRRVAEADSGDGVPMAVDPIGPAIDFNERFVHSWEDRVFHFPADSGQQPQLTLPAVVRGIAPEIDDLSAFTRLADFSVTSSGSAASALRDLGGRVGASEGVLRDSIRSAQTSLETITAQLEELYASPLPDAALIAELETQREELTQQLQQLQAGQVLVGSAAQHLEALTVPGSESED